MSRLTVYILLITVELIVQCHSKLACRNENGDVVDWFVMYKLPRMKEAAEESVQLGLGYVYMTSTEHKNWIFLNGYVSSNTSLPGNTLHPLYERTESTQDLIYVFYNDEHPHGPTSSNLGHTKGVVAFNDRSGFWLVHSVPHFPPAPTEQYDYPTSGEIFGQSFLCLSLDSKFIEAIAEQLLFNQPYIYASSISKQYRDLYPTMAQVVDKKFRRKSPWSNIMYMITPMGNEFISFAKSGEYHKEIYVDMVAPTLKSNLLTETWRNGPYHEQLPSNCSGPFTVRNIRYLTLQAVNQKRGGALQVAFANSRDHSKWALSADESKPWVCIGDINRMTTQELRGGGTVCNENHALWAVFAKMIKAAEPCPPKTTDENEGFWT